MEVQAAKHIWGAKITLTVYITPLFVHLTTSKRIFIYHTPPLEERTCLFGESREKYWNNLSVSVVASPTVNTFKKILGRVQLEVFSPNYTNV